MGRLVPPPLPKALVEQMIADGYTRDQIIRASGLNPNRNFKHEQLKLSILMAIFIVLFIMGFIYILDL